MNRIERITRALQALTPQHLVLRDDSHQHASHAAMKGIQGEHTHLYIEIASPEFTGKSRIESHRMVQNLCREEMDSGLHALQIKIVPV